VNEWIAPHLIRMAETRAVARAFRFATNVSMTAYEELGRDSTSNGSIGASTASNGSTKPKIVDIPDLAGHIVLSCKPQCGGWYVDLSDSIN